MEGWGDVAAAWNALATRLSVPEEIAGRWWTVISDHYREQQRYYHTLEHIRSMLNLHREYLEHVERQDLVELAIFFHDVIYEPKNKDNEDQSALLFQKFAAEVSLSNGDSDKVFEWIMHTKTHFKEPKVASSDLDYFLDLDLSILGASEQDYQRYAENIRKEYCHVEENVFKQVRAAVMQNFLQHQHLYRTPFFREKFEEKARENINQEIQRLTSSSSSSSS